MSARSVAPAHLAATLVILPLVLMPRRVAPHPGRLPEVVVQTTLLVGVLALVFLPDWPVKLSVLPLPLLVWAALRFTPYLVAAQVALLATVATTCTTLGTGPFARYATAPDPLQSGAQVQAYLVCAALMALPTALASAHRAHLLRRLDAEREMSARTLDATAAMIFVTDRDGTVLQCNGSVSRLTGFTPEDVLGRSFWASGLIAPDRLETVEHIFAEPDGSNVPDFREADVLTRTGDRLRVLWSNNVIRDEHGAVVSIVCTGTDVTSERSTSGLVRHLLEAPVSTALVALDEKGRVFLVNRGAEELLGRSESELTAQPVSTIVTSSHPLAFIRGEALEEGAATADSGNSSGCPVRGPETHDWTWVQADGTELVVSTTISVVTNVVGKVTGYLCVGRDVTEQRRSEGLLVTALDKERHVVDRLRRLDAAKNDFVSTVSHELRTPTTSIVGYTEMLREGAAGPVSPGQEVMLDAIARNGNRLIAVASDLLTLAGLESGDSAAWAREPVDLGTVVAHAAEAIHPLLTDRHLGVDFDISWDEVVVLGDSGHLDRVVMNLLSNAVKFTPDGGRVVCRLRREDDSAVLEVSDTGIGIPEDEQDELFTKFFRSSTAQERAIQGTGLGLSIISSIVTAHGGRIEVASAHLEGTTFSVYLPLTDQRPEPEEPDLPPTPADESLSAG